MKKLIFFLTGLALVFIFQSANSQNYENLTEKDFATYPYWIEMMQDQSVNFYDVQNAFEIYWEGREITKGCGWKPFKRWEYMMNSSINPDGTRPPADREWNEYFNYLKKFPEQKSSNGNWVNNGPYFIPSGKGYKGLGRLNAIAFHPTDPQIIYVGAPSGGLWETADGGNTWTSETDILPTLGVSAILVDYVNPKIMYIGTGDRDAGDAAGLGVMKSFDGGTTWEMYNNGMGTKIVGRMIMHPQNNELILAATNGGIYKTNDAGENWVSKKNGNFKEIVFKTDDPSIIFASANGNFYRSTDTGESWEEINSGLPNAARGVIGVTSANPDVVYFLLTNSSDFHGLYRSNDAGINFQEMSNSPNIMSWGCEGGTGGQAWYDLDIAVDPKNENVIFGGGVNCFKSTDGGINWEISSHWWGDCGVPSVHADLHVFEYNPLDNKLYAGNDGGIYWTDDGGSSWFEISNGLSIGQVYKIGQSATMRDKVINGYQDNGTSTFMGGTSWVNNIGGDGMECLVDYEIAGISYGTLYYGDIFRMLNNSNSFKVAGQGTFGITESGAWVTPFLLHETDPNTMFVGYKNVWRCHNIRTNNPNWVKISNSLGGVNSIDMRVLESSPANVNILYAARDDKKMFRSDNVNNQNPIWTDLSNNLPEGSSINDLEAHPFDENIVYMAQGNNVYKSTDKGFSWEKITGSLPNVSKRDIAYYARSQEGLYLATNIGIFYKDAFLSDWIMFDNGFPASARVTEVEIYYDPDNPENDIIHAATYGRGLWESDMYHSTPLADFSVDQTIIPPSCPVNFTDLSVGVPTTWEWTFEDGTPATSNQSNPEGILFENPGTFDVILTVTNEFGADTKIYEDLITVSEELLPEVDFTTDRQAVCTGAAVEFTDLSIYCPTTWEWSFNPDDVVYLYGTGTNSQNPVVQFQSAVMYNVTLTAGNSNGTASITKSNYIKSGGYTPPFYEDFESGNFTENGWTIENLDGTKTWEITTPIWAPAGEHTAFMNFFNYYNLSQRDRLISPPLNLEYAVSPELRFKYAYAQRYSQIDSLIVYVSYDCGENWERIYANGPDGNGIFETAPGTNVYFDPASSEDWCGQGFGAECVEIPLSPELQPNVMLMFESYNRFGNNLYLDEIHVPLNPGIDEVLYKNDDIQIYPNPSDGLVTLIFNKSSENVMVTIKNMHGQTIYVKEITSCTEQQNEVVDFTSLRNGIYLIQVTGDNINVVKIFILQ